jgi:hypothetical protein
MEKTKKSEITLEDYKQLFIQNFPTYAVKSTAGKRWKTVDASKNPLDDKLVTEHLESKKYVANIGKWYPMHAFFDFDRIDINAVLDTRDSLGMDESNSMLCSSESQDSYHLLFRPTYNGKPSTLKLLNDIIQPFAENKGIEAYPQAKKNARLPFSKIQGILNQGYEGISEWQKKLYWFNKLDEYELTNIPYNQSFLPMQFPDSKGKISSYREGQELLQTGLQCANSRYDAQFKVLYYLWRRNVPMATSVLTVYNWIKTKNNGFSEGINKGNWYRIKKEIERQASKIYSDYTLPDETHNYTAGYITKDDIPKILGLTDGSFPKARFLFHLLKYYYPRRLRGNVQVHSDKLREWSSYRTYLRRISELKNIGVLKRRDFYIIGEKSKDITLNWDFSHPENAILIDERAPDTFEETIRQVYKIDEIRVVLKQSGIDRRNINHYLKRIFEPTAIKQRNDLNNINVKISA